MPERKASDLFVSCLEAEGVTRIFGVPGEENADFMMSLHDSPIEQRDQAVIALVANEPPAGLH